jgi:hypothetical protein
LKTAETRSCSGAKWSISRCKWTILTFLAASIQTTLPAPQTRRRLLEDAATKGYIVAPAHLPFAGLGHMRKDGHAYTWVPVDYVNDAQEK